MCDSSGKGKGCYCSSDGTSLESGDTTMDKTCSSISDCSDNPERLSFDQDDLDQDPLFRNIHKPADRESIQTPKVQGKSVPLRQRELPASFWIEPNKPKTCSREHDLYFSADRINKYGYNSSDNGIYNDLFLPAVNSYMNGAHRLYQDIERSKMAAMSPYYCDMYKGSCNRLPSGYPDLQEMGSRYGPKHWSASYINPGLKSIQGYPQTGITRAELAMYYQGQGMSSGYDQLTAQNPLSHRAHLWKPIATKTTAGYSSNRFHPFANAH